MNVKVILTGALALAAATVAPVVIGRNGGELAGLLRIDVLVGLGLVATLVALITLEYGRGAARAVRQPAALRTVSDDVVPSQTAKVAVLATTNRDTRAAA